MRKGSTKRSNLPSLEWEPRAEVLSRIIGRNTTWLVAITGTLSLVVAALSVLFLTLNLSYPDVHIYDYWLENTLLSIGFSSIGPVIAFRRPENPIGWISCAGGFLLAMVHLVAEYAIYALLAAPGSVPGGQAAAWLYSWLWVLPLGLIVLLLLLFPEGRLPSSRWRPFAWLSVPSVAVGAVLLAFSPGAISVGLGPIQNPLGIADLPNLYKVVQTLVYALMLVAATSLFARLYRSVGIERQQIKWVGYAAAAAASGLILTYIVPEAISAPWLERVGFVILVIGVLGGPISMGIAITRYRLYEIDIVINRSLVYGPLTATLALVYFGSVTALQYLLSLLTGQGGTLAIVASTLSIAALFNPLRRRIQSFIDHRFYRRRYDAAKTLESFGAKLREETDLERLCEDLKAVVHETLQPAYVSLWLRPTPPPPGRSEETSESAAGKAEAQ